MKCDIIPRIKQEDGSLEDSILFKELLRNFNRDTAKDVYRKLHTKSFIDWFGSNWIEEKQESGITYHTGEPRIIDGKILNERGDSISINKIAVSSTSEVKFGDKLQSELSRFNINKKVVIDDELETTFVDETSVNLSSKDINKELLPRELSHIYLHFIGINSSLFNRGLELANSNFSTLKDSIIDKNKDSNYSKTSLDLEFLVSAIANNKNLNNRDFNYWINQLHRKISDILSIDKSKSQQLFNSLYSESISIPKETNIVELKANLNITTLDQLKDLNDKDTYIELTSSLLDVESSRKNLEYTKDDIYSSDSSKLDDVLRDSNLTRLGNELFEGIRSGDINKNKIKILVPNNASSGLISFMFKIPKENVIKYNTSKDVNVGTSISYMSSPVKESLDSLQGDFNFISTIEEFKPVDSTITYLEKINKSELESMLGSDLFKELKDTVEKETLALQKRLEHFESIKTENPENTQVGDKAIKRIKQTLKDIRDKDAKSQFIIMVERATSDLKSISSYLNKKEIFNKLDYSTASNLVFVNKFLDTYRHLDRQDFTKGDPLLSKLVSNFNKVFNRVSFQYPEKTRDYITTLINETITNPELKGRKDLIQEELLRGDDIAEWERRLGILAASDNKLLSTIDNIFKERKREVYERSDKKEKLISEAGDKLRKSGITDFDFMINKEDGTYVSRTSSNYYDELRKLENKLKDENGKYRKYIEINDSNISEMSEEDISYNIGLEELKKLKREFIKPEIYNPKTKQLSDGINNKYTEEFKKERSNFEFFNPSSMRWEKKGSVSDLDYQLYLKKYYTDEIEYLSPIKENGISTGKVEWKSSKFPKQQYIITTDKWNDPRYNEIAKDKNKLEFYNLFLEELENSLLKLPISVSKSFKGRLPAISKHYLDRLSDNSNKLKAIGSNIRKSIIPEAIISHRILDEKGHAIDSVPILYVNNLKDIKKIEELEEKLKTLDPVADKVEYQKINRLLYIEKNKLESSDISTDLVDSLIKFSAMAENYEVMSQLESTLLLADQVIKNKKFFVKDAKGNYISDSNGLRVVDGVDSKVQARFKDWMNMIFYQNTEENNTITAQVAKKVMKYSSLRNLGLNFPSAVNNAIIGGIFQRIEGWGGQFYSTKDLRKARSEFRNYMSRGMFQELGDNNAYYSKDTPKHKVSAMVKDWNILQDQREAGQRTESKGFLKGMLDLGWAYKLHDIGEYANQTTLAISIMNNTKTKDNNGNEISVWDAHYYKDGKFLLKDGVKFSEQEKRKLINKIIGVNQLIHGRYTDEDKAALQKHWLGQAAFHYKKWVIPAIEARFRKKYYDERIGEELEGRYRSFAPMFKYLIEHKGNIMKSWNTLSDLERANMRKNLAELTFFTASVASLILFSKLAEDVDDDDYLLNKSVNFLVLQSSRQADEISTFVNPLHAYKTVKDPFASLGMLGEAAEFMKALVKLPYNYATGQEDNNVYQRGVYKDKSKVSKEAIDLLPIARMINAWRRLDETEQFYIK